MVITTTGGLYLAYEIARGVALIGDADNKFLDLSDQLIRIAKTFQKSRKAPDASKELILSTRGGTEEDNAASADEVETLVLLLAHSHVQLDLRAMGETLRAAAQSQRLGNVLILPPDQITPVFLSSLPRLHSLIIPADGRRGFQRIVDRHSSATRTGVWLDRGQSRSEPE